MDLQSEKRIIIERLNKLNDVALIEMIRNLLDYGLKNQEGRISEEQYNHELEIAEDEIQYGNGVSHNSIEDRKKNW